MLNLLILLLAVIKKYGGWGVAAMNGNRLQIKDVRGTANARYATEITVVRLLSVLRQDPVKDIVFSDMGEVEDVDHNDFLRV